MKQRLASIEEKMVTDETMKKFCATSRMQSDTDERAHVKTLLIRKRRSLALSLESLEKRLKILEFRRDHFVCQSCRCHEMTETTKCCKGN